MDTTRDECESKEQTQKSFCLAVLGFFTEKCDVMTHAMRDIRHDDDKALSSADNSMKQKQQAIRR